MRLVHKIDDILLLEKSYEQAMRQTYLIVTVFTRLGFIFNAQKCETEPETWGLWHGCLWCTQCMACGMPTEKTDKVQLQMRELRALLQSPRSTITVRRLSKTLGVAMYQKDGVDACRNMLCELQELKGFLLQDSKIDYDTPVNVGSILPQTRKLVIKECERWLQHPNICPTPVRSHFRWLSRRHTTFLLLMEPCARPE